MTFQRALGTILFALAPAGTILQWRLVDRSFRPWLLCSTYVFLALIFSFSFLFWTILVKPHCGSLRHLPTAPQGPVHRRLFKEPNAFHFGRWINEVPNDGFIRYFGFLNMERILLTSPLAVREVLDFKAYAFEKQYSHKTHLARLAGDSLVTVEGNVHKFQRKVINPAFWPRQIGECYFPIFWLKAGELSRQLSTHIKAKSSRASGDKPQLEADVTVDNLISRTIYDIIGVAAFDQDLRCLQDPDHFHSPNRDYRHAFDPSTATRTRMLLALIFPTWLVDKLPNNFNKTTGPSIDAVRSNGANYLETKIRSPDLLDIKKINSATSTDLEKASESKIEKKYIGKCILEIIMDQKQFSHVELLDQYMMFLSGGTHTSITAVKSAIWYLGRPEYAHIQDLVRDEIRSNLPSCECGTDMDFNKMESLPYLTSIRDEILRLQSAFSTTGRTAIRHTEVCGVLLPPGVPISISPWAMHRSHRLWGPDASDFKPGRWLGNGDSQPVPTEPGSFISFGLGRRACIGDRFAKAELNCLLAAIFGRFKIEFRPGMEIPGLTHQVTLAFKKEMKVHMTVIEGW